MSIPHTADLSSAILQNYEHQNAFCIWLLQLDATFPASLNQVSMKDEACLTWNRVLDAYNQHTFAHESPRPFQETRFQQHFQ
jgi:hypothetical protein